MPKCALSTKRELAWKALVDRNYTDLLPVDFTSAGPKLINPKRQKWVKQL